MVRCGVGVRAQEQTGRVLVGVACFEGGLCAHCWQRLVWLSAMADSSARRSVWWVYVAQDVAQRDMLHVWYMRAMDNGDVARRGVDEQGKSDPGECRI